MKFKIYPTGTGTAAVAATSLFFTGVDNIALVSQTIVPSGGIAPYSFVGVGLPAGVTVGAATGVISGTPTSPGNTSASVTITDSAANTLSLPVFFAIATGTFADSFHRADQPFYVGDQWAVQPVTFSTCLGTQIAASINVAGNQLNLSICSSNGFNGLALYPIPISWEVMFSRAQYSQARMTADNSGAGSFGFNGPCAMYDPNKNTGYFLLTNSPDGGGTNVLGKYTVRSLNGGAAGTNIHTNLNFAVGDLLRIEAYPNTPLAGQTTVKSFVNGVQQSSDVDAANAYSFCIYGILDYFVSAGITQSWDNFQGGAAA